MAWWRDAVFYEIYIRSFQDSNGDGIGDLNGITQRLPYLVDLGIDGIWITPFYPSPQIDFGYDISDHEAVDPQFGTLADVDALMARAHALGLKVVLDLVLNHTSDQHPWFLSARASRDSPYRDWYVWREGREGSTAPPTNWESAFGGPAWTPYAGTGEWYYHAFYPEQPDLNWRNPAVEARMLAVVDFWLDRGVDGFRLDAVNTLFEDAELRDNPLLPEPRVTIIGVQTQRPLHTRALPEIDGVLRRIRDRVERRAPETLLVSEAYVETPTDLLRFYDACGMHLPFNFFLAEVPRLDAQSFASTIAAVEGAFGERWPSLVLSNHDIARACDRYRDDHPDAIARLLAAFLCTGRGTPFIYYGEEIAMRTVPPASIDEVRDPVARRFWPAYKGRDGSRRPMQWAPPRDSPSSSHDATHPQQALASDTDASPPGFTSGVPWLPLAPDAAVRHVQGQLEDPSSVLHTWRTLLRLRRGSGVLRHGTMRMVDVGPDVLAYVRELGTQRMLAVLNLGDAPRRLERPVGDSVFDDAGFEGWEVVFGTHRHLSGSGADFSGTLAPFEALVLKGRER